jgi:uroporphyrinogen decarboxylase
MNSQERVRAALLGQPLDRVPIVEFVIDPKVAMALVPTARDIADACDRLELDSIANSATFLRVKEQGDEYQDEWGLIYRKGPQVVSHPLQGPISAKKDLRRWEPPDPDAPFRLNTLRENVRRYKGKRAIFFHHRAAFMWSAYLVGLDRLLELFYDDPTFVHELFSKVAAVNERIIRLAVRAGAEVICLGDDYASNAGPLFSPQMFREFVLPYMKQMVDAVHDEGALVVKHSDGYIQPILADIVNAGIDGLNPLEPCAGMDLAEVKAAYGSRVCLIGNIDCGELLSHGAPEQVAAAVAEAIRVGAPGGRYMLSSSNSIHASVNPDNYRVMIETGLRLGRYS